jgi:flavin-dependent dehydrogenase
MGCFLQGFRPCPDGIRVTYSWNGQEYQAETKFLIGADGAASTVRKRLNPEIEPRKYIAIQEWFKVRKSNAYYAAIFDPDITDFYAWTIPKEDYLLVGAALIPHQMRPDGLSC